MRCHLRTPAFSPRDLGFQAQKQGWTASVKSWLASPDVHSAIPKPKGRWGSSGRGKRRRSSSRVIPSYCTGSSGRGRSASGTRSSEPLGSGPILNQALTARRQMLGRLAGRELTVGELAAPPSMSLAAASNTWGAGRSGGQDVTGRRHVCRLQPEALARADAWLRFYERFWDERLDALDQVLAGQDEPSSGVKTAPSRRRK